MEKTSWYDENEDEMINGASEVIEALAIGIKETEVAEDTGVDEVLIQQWLSDPEFLNKVKTEKKELERSINEAIKVKSLMRSKEDFHNGFNVSCSFIRIGCDRTKKQQKLILEKYFAEIRKAVFKAIEPKVESEALKAKIKKSEGITCAKRFKICSAIE